MISSTKRPRRLIGRIDVLVAVPPYVPVGRAHELPREAREHEPAVALYSRLGYCSAAATAWLAAVY